VPFALALAVLAMLVVSGRAVVSASERVAAWTAHSVAVWDLEIAADRYLDQVQAQVDQPSDPQSTARTLHALDAARTKSWELAQRFPTEEQALEKRLDVVLDETVALGEAVSLTRDAPALERVRAQYARDVVPLLQSRMSEEQDGINASMAALHRGSRWFMMAAAFATAIALLAGIFVSIALARQTLRTIASLAQKTRGIQSSTADSSSAAASDEFADLDAELDNLKASLSRQRHVRNGFLAGVAHDLRSPLSTLKLTSEIGAEATLGPERFQLAMARVRRQVDRLDQLAGELRDVAGIEEGTLELRLADTDLCELVRESIDVHAQLSPHHTLTLKAHGGPVIVRCDAARIQRVMDNLIGNAVKYSPAGGPVTVAIEHAQASGEVVLLVTDSGLGIAPQDQERIFEPFQRGSVVNDTIPGAGLGLAICRRIAMAHSGSVSVTSTVGHGSTFQLRLPSGRDAP